MPLFEVLLLSSLDPDSEPAEKGCQEAEEAEAVEGRVGFVSGVYPLPVRSVYIAVVFTRPLLAAVCAVNITVFIGLLTSSLDGLDSPSADGVVSIVVSGTVSAGVVSVGTLGWFSPPPPPPPMFCLLISTS